MTRTLIILILSILPIVTFGQDEVALAALDAKVDRYLAALETEPMDVKCAEADFIISSCTDSTVLTRVANRVYKHYIDSKLMGDDAVAIHVFDTWFADKAVKMGSEDEFFAATFFAATNRNSLIGCYAPQLKLYAPNNEEVTLFNGLTATHSVLFFYDVGCPVCRAETKALTGTLEKYGEKLTLYAVYIGSDGEKWAEFRRENFGETATIAGSGAPASGGDGSSGEIIHLWDSEMTSNIAFDYGVVGTPRLFLISPNGKIIGRSLDSAALETLLDIVLETKTFEYGSQGSMDMYDRTFEDSSEPCANVSEVAAHIEGMLLPRGDTLLFKQMTGDLLYFLTSRKEARFKCGSEVFIDTFILNRPDIWDTADDSLQVVSLGLFVKELLNLCPLGEKLPAIEVPAEVLTRKGRGATAQTDTDGVKVKTTVLRLDKQKSCAIMFHTNGCPICAENLAGARNILRTGSPVPNTDIIPKKIILVDMYEIWLAGGDLPDKLMANFDLSSLPFIICIDGAGRVAYKYADFN